MIPRLEAGTLSTNKPASIQTTDETYATMTLAKTLTTILLLSSYFYMIKDPGSIELTVSS